MWRTVSYDRPRTGRRVTRHAPREVVDGGAADTAAPRDVAVDRKAVKRFVALCKREPLALAVSSVAAACLDRAESVGRPHLSLNALGVGSLDNEASQIQFAFFVALRDALADRMEATAAPAAATSQHNGTVDSAPSTSPARLQVTFFDPVATEEDRKIAEGFGVPCDTENTLGAIRITSSGPAGAAADSELPNAPVPLFVGFMPRCPRDLYHNTIASALTPPSPSPSPAATRMVVGAEGFVLIGNDLGAYLDTSVYGAASDKRPLAFNAIDVVLPYLTRLPLSFASGSSSRGAAQGSVHPGLEGLCLQYVTPGAAEELRTRWADRCAALGLPKLARGGDTLA